MIKNKVVLVVEDEKPLNKVLSSKLDKEGFTVLVSENGEDGLHLALSKHPDVILLDIVMPKMDGIEMMKRLRKDKWGKTVPIIIMSNLSANESKTVQAIVESEPLYYLIKSDWRLEDMVEKVKEATK